MVGHQKILHLLLYEKSYESRNCLQVENTQDRNLGEGGGRGKRNLKANSFKRKSEKALSESVNLKALISRRLYYQVIRGVTCQKCNLSEGY